MWIIGVDYHPSVQQIAFVNTDTGECGERRLNHSDGEAEKFYREAGCGAALHNKRGAVDSQLRGVHPFRNHSPCTSTTNGVASCRSYRGA